MTQLLHADTTDRVLRAYYTVYNTHGHDYPEAFFEEMMRLEFAVMSVSCTTQVEYQVVYKGVIVGRHITDMEIGEGVILELKVKDRLLPRDQAQLISNLKVARKPVGLLLNFGSLRPETIRRVLTPFEGKNQPLWTPGEPDLALPYPTLRLMLRKATWEVYHELGAGFVHRIYVNAACVEMRRQAIPFHHFRKLIVFHRNHEIGQITFHHLIIDDKLVLAPVTVAIITASEINKVRAIMQQYGLSIGMIVNFQNEKLEVRYIKEK